MGYEILKQFTNSHVENGDSVLDIGCGQKLFKPEHCGKYVTVDSFEKCKPKYLINLEIENLPFEENSFDVVFMLDFIEHLDKDRGNEILKQAKKITKKKLILFTPMWWDDNHENIEKGFHEGNIHNLHKSLWSGEEEELQGFIVYVIPPFENYFLGVYDK
ncbi:MAG: class I SAM-dependent methyltransferase [Bacteroidales bacterium]|jgi:SAM-dependent methyltransferase|nr:class I SAM-dependent methyltransferase [Bacteroidales bacterium]